MQLITSFTAAGRKWHLELSLLQVRRVQSATGGFMLPRVIDLTSDEYKRLGSDAELLCVVLAVLLSEPLKEARLSLDELLEKMTGEEASGAISALVGAVANFSRSRTAAATARLIQQGLEQLTQLDQKAGEMLEGLPPSGSWFGSPPASPESSPGDTHSAISPSTLTPPPGGSHSSPGEDLPWPPALAEFASIMSAQ